MKTQSTTEQKMKSFSLTYEEYFRIQSLFGAISRDFSRMSLTFVHYNPERDEFIATDGHVLRVEKIHWGERIKPEVKIFLTPENLIYSKSQLKRIAQNKYQSGQGPIWMDASFDVEYDENLYEKSGPYPNYEVALPKPEAQKDVAEIGIDPALVQRFIKTVTEKTRCLRFVFSGSLGGIAVHTTGGDFGPVFKGVIMPARIITA